MKRVPLLLAAVLASLPQPTVNAQTSVTDSVRIQRYVYEYYFRNGQGYYLCGAGLWASFPDVKARILDREVQFGEYALKATEGEQVPTWFVDFENSPQLEEQGIVVPEGHRAFSVFGGGSQSSFAYSPTCADAKALAVSADAGAPFLLNARVYRATDWYAVFTLPEGQPVAEFEYDQSQQLVVDFDASFESGLSREVGEPNVPVVSYEWDFGNSSSGSGPNPSATYEEPGLYTVTLTVTDDDGQTDVLQRSIRVFGLVLTSEVTVVESRTYREAEEVVAQVRVSNAAASVEARNIRIPRFISFVATYPDAPADDVFRGLTPTKFARADEQDEAVIASLGAGQSQTVTVTYKVESSPRYVLAGGALSVVADLRAVLSGIIRAEDADGNPATVRDACEATSCESDLRVEPVISTQAVVVGESAAPADEFVVDVVVQNHGDAPVTNVTLASMPRIWFTDYGPLVTPTGKTPPTLSIVEGPLPPAVSEIAAGGQVILSYRLKVDEAAVWTKQDLTTEFVESVISLVSTQVNGRYKDTPVLAGCLSGRCDDDIAVYPPGDLLVSVEFANVEFLDGGASEAFTGLKRRVSTTLSNWIVEHRVPRASVGIRCISGCVDVMVTVHDEDGNPVEGAEVELAAEPITGQPVVVTPDQGGGYFCTTDLSSPACGRPLKLEPTDADGKTAAVYWLPGLIQSKAASVEAVATTNADETGRRIADIRLEPTPVDFINEVAEIGAFEMAGLSLSVATASTLDLVNLGNWCKSGFRKLIGRKKVEVSDYFVRAAEAAIEYGCGKALEKFDKKTKRDIADKLVLLDIIKRVSDVVNLYWFLNSFEVSGDGTAEIVLESFGPPFIGYKSEFVDAIFSSLHQMIDQYNASGALPNPTLKLWEVSHRKQDGTFAHAMYYSFRNAQSTVDVSTLIDEFYDAGSFLRQTTAIASTAGPIDPDDAVLSISRSGSAHPLIAQSADHAGAAEGSVVRADSALVPFEVGHVVLIDPGLETEEMAQIVGGDSTAVELSAPLRYAHAAGTLVVRVDSAAVGPPLAPMILPGASGMPGQPREPFVSWYARVPAISYSVEVAADSLFANIIQSHSDVAADSLVLDQLDERGTYYWRVAGTNLFGQGEWSTFASIVVGRPIGDDLSETFDFGDELGTFASALLFGATSEAGEQTGSCSSGANSMWYSYTTPVSRRVSFETFDSGFDTALSVWTGSAHPLVEVACSNDYDNHDHAPVQQSYVEFDASPGTTYYIRVAGEGDAEGIVLLTLRAPTAVAVEEAGPANPESLTVSVYPNPVRGEASLSIGMPHRGAVAVDVFDALGRLVASPVVFTLEAGQHRVELDVSRLSAGRYYARTRTGRDATVTAFLVL